MRPLAISAAGVSVTLLLVGALRLMLASSGFFVAQLWAVVVLSAGLLLTAVLYAMACRIELRRVALAEPTDGSAGRRTLGLLIITGLIMAVPVLLAVLAPQQPAP